MNDMFYFPQSFAPETHDLTGNIIHVQLHCHVSSTQTQAIIIIHHFTSAYLESHAELNKLICNIFIREIVHYINS